MGEVPSIGGARFEIEEAGVGGHGHAGELLVGAGDDVGGDGGLPRAIRRGHLAGGGGHGEVVARLTISN